MEEITSVGILKLSECGVHTKGDLWVNKRTGVGGGGGK